jgi:hypothetical protein
MHDEGTEVASWLAMRVSALIIVLVCGCGSSSSCPTTEPGQRSACATQSDVVCRYGTDTECECDGAAWYCVTSNCPPGIPGGQPLACTSSDDGCAYSDWEHDCTCGCQTSSQGRWWSCTRGTIGSICPAGPPDTGVDAR